MSKNSSILYCVVLKNIHTGKVIENSKGEGGGGFTSQNCRRIVRSSLTRRSGHGNGGGGRGGGIKLKNFPWDGMFSVF